MADINPIYKFMKDNNLTQKDEASFVQEYSNPEKAKELYGFMNENSLTTKDYDSFYGEYLKKKDPLQPVAQNTLEQFGLPSGTFQRSERQDTEQVVPNETSSDIQSTSPSSAPIKEFPVNLQLGNKAQGLGSNMLNAPDTQEIINVTGERPEWVGSVKEGQNNRLGGYLESYANANGITPEEAIASQIPIEEDKDGKAGTALLKGLFGTSGSFYDIPRLLYGFTGMEGVKPYDEFLQESDLMGLGNPLVAMDRVAKRERGVSNQYANQMKTYEDGIYESAKKGNWGDAGSQLLNTVAESAPSMAAMFAGSGVANALKLGVAGKNLVMAAPFASSKYVQIENNPDIPNAIKPTIAIAYGLAETVAEEAFGSKAAIGALIDTFKTSGKKVAQEAAEKTFTGYIQKAIARLDPAVVTTLGGISEGATQLAQNFLDIISGEDPERKMTDGLIDSMLAGVAMSGAPVAIGQAAKPIIKNIDIKNSRKEVADLGVRNADILNDLENLELTPEQRDNAFSAFENNNTKIAENLANIESKVKKLSDADKAAYEALDEKAKKLAEFKNTDGLSKGTVSSIEQQTAEIEAQQNELIAESEKKTETRFPNINELSTEVQDEVIPKIERIQDIDAEIAEMKKEGMAGNPEADLVLERQRLYQEINNTVENADIKPVETTQAIIEPEAVETPIEEKEAVVEPVPEEVPVVESEVIEPVEEVAPEVVPVEETVIEETPVEPERTVGVTQIPTSEIVSDPKRFQFKEEGIGEGGVSDKLKGRKYNPELAGVVSVWLDPADGKTYVINGHHRLDLAKANNIENLDVRYIDAESASEARQIGALQNIAEGQGTDLDAAKMFREAGANPDALKEAGLSLSESRANNGLALSSLSESLFNAVVSGKIPQNVGVIIGNNIANTDVQNQFYDKIKNRKLSQATIQVMAQDINNAKVTQSTVTDLFGTTVQDQAQYEQRASLISGIRSNILKAKNLLGKTAASKEFLEQYGNVIDAETSKGTSGEAALALAAFDALRNSNPLIKRLIDNGIKRIENGESKSSVYADIAKKAIGEIPDIISGKETQQVAGGESINEGRERVQPKEEKVVTKPKPSIPTPKKSFVENLSDAEYRANKAEELKARIAKYRESNKNLGISKDSEAEAKHWRDITDLAIIQIVDGVVETAQQLADMLGIENNARFKEAFEEAQQSVNSDKALVETTARNVDSAQKRAAYGFDERLPINKRIHADVVAEAKKALESGYDVGALIDRINGGEAINDLETSILSTYVAAKEVELVKITQNIETNLKDSSADTFTKEVHNREQIRVDFLQSIDALERSGTANARALSIRRALVQADFSLASMIIDRRNASGNARLTAEQMADVEAKFASLKESMAERTAEIEKLNTDVERLKIENEFLKKQAKKTGNRANIRASKTSSRADAIEVHKSNIASLKERLIALNRESRAELSSTPIKPEAISILAQIGYEYAAIGGINAVELVDKVYEDVRDVIEGVTKRDIRDALSGYNQDNDTRKPKTQLQKDISDIRKELRLLSQIEDAENRVSRAKTPTDKSIETQRITELKERLKSVRQANNQKTDTELIEMEKQRVQERIQEVQRQILENDFQSRGEAKNKPTDDVLEALKKQERDLIKQRDALDIRKQNELSEKEREAYKQRLADDILDIDRQIANKRKDRLQKNTKFATDQEINDLRRIKSEKMDMLNQIDPTAIEEARERSALRNIEKSIKDIEERIANNELLPKEKKRSVNTPELERLRKERDVLNAKLEQIRKDALEAGNPELLEANMKARERFAQKRYDNIKNAIKNGNYRTEKTTPPPSSPELKAINKKIKETLAEVYKENARLELRNRNNWTKAADLAVEISGLPRQIMSSVDLSAIFRQGAFLLSRPQLATKAFLKGLTFWASSEKYEQWNDDIKASPGYELMQKAGLDLTLKDLSPKLIAKEELFQSRILQYVPVLGATQTYFGKKVYGIDIFGRSERNYTGTLNKLRTDVFTHGVELLQRQGYDTVNDLDAYKALANYVNIATGRGNLGKFKESAKNLSSIMFAPRFFVSRLQFMTGAPLYMKGTTNVVREMYARDLVGYLAMGAIMMGVGRMFGGDVEDDPNSTDFGKIRIDDTRIDTWAGSQQLAVLASRVISGKYKTISGKETLLDGSSYNGTTEGDVIGRFARSKLSPVAGLGVSYFYRSNYMGERFQLGKEVMSIILPMAPKDIYENISAIESPFLAAATIPLTILGGSIQTYRTNDFLQRGVDNKSIELLNKNKALVNDPYEKQKKIYDAETGEKREMTNAEYRKYSNTYLDKIKSDLEEKHDELVGLSSDKFESKLNSIKRNATVMAEESVSGVTNSMLKISLKDQNFFLNPEQVRQRIDIQDKFIEDNKAIYADARQRFISAGYSDEKATFEAKELIRKAAEKQSRAIILQEWQEGKIELSEIKPNE